MNRLINVKGFGSVSIKPDLIIITMRVVTKNLDYEKMMMLSTVAINDLQEAIESVGFDKKDLKTTSFNVNTHYESYRDKNDNYKSKFAGYVCEHGLKIEFDFNTVLLSKVLNAITTATVNPNLNIQFSVKDKTAVYDELLIQATQNARRKAEILAKASNVALGNLISIEYNWNELKVYSPTRYDMNEECMMMNGYEAPDIQPDDIDLKDSVSFIWEII